jgi:peptidoglycan-associated lipoprotein
MPAASSLPTEAVDDVFFDYDRSTLRSDAKTTLESNARVLKPRNGTKLLIEGHCDERGTSAYNLVLGERRAQSVKRYLQDLGIPVSQLHITSYGKERPFCRDHREACWQQNRRAHVVVQ